MIYQPIPEKRCTKCKQYFPATLEHFQLKRHGLYGVNAVCKPCYSQHYTRRNQAKATERVRIWRANNPERNKAIEQRKRKNNPERLKEDQRRCRAKHPERYRERVQHCRHAKPAQYAGYKHVRRAREANAPATLTAVDWEQALAYFGNRCAVCGNQHRKLSQDHWIPVAKGGAYTPDNILPMCHGKNGCNNLKNDSEPIEWLFERYDDEQAHEILACIESYFEIVRVLADHDA